MEVSQTRRNERINGLSGQIKALPLVPNIELTTAIVIIAVSSTVFKIKVVPFKNKFIL